MDNKNIKENSFPDSSDKNMNVLTNDFIKLLNGLIKTARMYDVKNIAFRSRADEMIDILNKLWEGKKEISLRLKDNYLYLSGTKLKMQIDVINFFMSVIEIFKSCKVGEIGIRDSVTANELIQFINILGNLNVNNESPFELLQENLIKGSISSFSVTKLDERELSKNIADNKEIAKKTYFKTVSVVSELMEGVKLKKVIQIKKAKRMVHNIIDQIIKEESTIMGLTTIRSYDEYTYNHSVNVCIYAIAIGQRLGLTRNQLSDLGLAALFHDIGKSDIPLEILNKPAEFNEEEWNIMKKHPVMGIKKLMQIKGFNELIAKVMIGIFEHHLNYDLSGYPKLGHKRNISIVGKIISIVDCYDAMTSSRVYNRIPNSPDKTLKIMLEKSGTSFDPVVIKTFVNCMGIYPLGTVLLLDTNELGLVVQTNLDPDYLNRPKIVLVDHFGEIIDNIVIDLAEQEKNTGNFKRNIVKTIDNTKVNIDSSKYFL